MRRPQGPFGLSTTPASTFAPLLPLEPWMAGAALLSAAPPELRDWLTEQGLLTDRIETACRAAAGLTLIEERQGVMTAEQQALLQAPAVSCFVRRIELTARGRPWVYAESLIPNHTLELHPWLALLGASSLGATLAACPDLSRGSFEFAPLPAAQPLAARALARAGARAAVVWARRSWFALADRRLLVQELFLPELGRC